MTWHVGELRGRDAATTGRSSCGRSSTRCSRRCSCLLLGYPLAYAIAFKAGRWKNLMLVLVIAPFFTSFLVRTLSWQLILGDNGLGRRACSARCTCSAPTAACWPPRSRWSTGLTYNFLPFMVLPLYASLEKIDHRLIEAAGDLYADPVHRVPQGHAAAVDARRWSPGTLLTFIPAAGDYINAELLGSPQHPDDRQRDPGPVRGPVDYPIAAALSVTLMVAIVVHGARLRPPRRDRGAGDDAGSGRWVGEHLVLFVGAARAALHVHRRSFVVIADVVQRPGEPATLQLRRVHLGQLAAPLRPAQLCDVGDDAACRSACSPRSSPPCSGR